LVPGCHGNKGNNSSQNLLTIICFPCALILQTKFGWKQASGLRGDVVWKCEQAPDGRRTAAGHRTDAGRRTESDHKSSSWAYAQVSWKCSLLKTWCIYMCMTWPKVSDFYNRGLWGNSLSFIGSNWNFVDSYHVNFI